jgi:hypothetical protein
MLLQQGKGRLHIGSLAKPAAGGLMGVTAAELHLVGAADPLQEPAGVLHARVGPHQVEHRPGMVDQVAGQAGGAGKGVGVDRASPAVAQMPRQVQEPREAAGDTGELGRPAGHVG